MILYAPSIILKKIIYSEKLSKIIAYLKLKKKKKHDRLVHLYMCINKRFYYSIYYCVLMKQMVFIVVKILINQIEFNGKMKKKTYTQL